MYQATDRSGRVKTAWCNYSIWSGIMVPFYRDIFLKFSFRFIFGIFPLQQPWSCPYRKETNFPARIQKFPPGKYNIPWNFPHHLTNYIWKYITCFLFHLFKNFICFLYSFYYCYHYLIFFFTNFARACVQTCSARYLRMSSPASMQVRFQW